MDEPPTIPRAREDALPESATAQWTRASRYADLGRLGAGAMGDVRLCEDRSIGREVALKVAHVDTDPGAPLRARFLHEARIQARLEHPSIVPVYDMGTDAAGAPYFTMKRVRGVTLRRVIEKLRAGDPETEAHFTRRRLLTAFASVCLTVDFAHGRDVLHRDLKPSNIMLGDYGEIYVLDWGVARVAGVPDDANGRSTPSPEPGITEAGAIVGTPGYAAPAQVRGEALDGLHRGTR